MMKLPVPKLIYEAIEDVLEGQIRRLIKDISKTLSVPDIPLEKISIYIVEESSEDYYLHTHRCKSFEQVGKIYLPCDDLVVYKKEFCIKHNIKHILLKDLHQFQALTQLIYNSKKYYKDNMNIVYDTLFNKVGKYIPEAKKLILFNIILSG